MVEPAGDPSMLFDSTRRDSSGGPSLIQQSVSCLYEKNIVQNPTTARMLLMFLRDFVDSQTIYSPWSQPCFCPMMKCRETFTEPLSLIQHLLFCSELSQGEFECWKCRRCHGFPTNEKDWAEWSGWTPHRIDDCPKTPVAGPENEYTPLSPDDFLSKAFLEAASASERSPVSTWDQLSNPSIQSQLGSPDVFGSAAQGSEIPNVLGLGTAERQGPALNSLQTSSCAPWTSTPVADSLIADHNIDWSGFSTDDLGLLLSPNLQQAPTQLDSSSAMTDVSHTTQQQTGLEASPASTEAAQSTQAGQMQAPTGSFAYPALSPFTPPPSMYSVGGFIAMSRTSAVSDRGHTHSASTSPFWSSRHGQPPFAAIRNSRSLVPRKRRASFATRQGGAAISSAPSITSPNLRSASIPEIRSTTSLSAATSPVCPTQPNRFSSRSASSFEDFASFNTAPTRGIPEHQTQPPETPSITGSVHTPFTSPRTTDDFSSHRHSDAISMDTTLAESTAAEDDDEELKCDLCDWKPRGVKENLKGYLRKHKNNHRGVRYPCEIPGCKKTFSRLDNLKKHIKDKHGIDVTTGAGLTLPVRKAFAVEEAEGPGAEPGPEMMVMTIPKRPRDEDGAGSGADLGGQAKVSPQHTMLWHLNL